MTDPDAPAELCMPVVSVLTREHVNPDTFVSGLTDTWPNLRLLAPPYHFHETEYYHNEMGSPLFRWWAYRPRLSDPSNLIEWKKNADDIESQFRSPDGARMINVDPGYITLGLLVLASHKENHQKIYLGSGVYADPVLEYLDGEFQAFHWTFPDFQKNKYYSILEKFRERYKTLRNE